MENRPFVISCIQYILLLTIFSVPLFSLDYLAFSVIEKTFLFYVLVEITFGLWLYAALQNRAYLPTRNPLLIVGGVFLISYTISGLLSASPETALWSTMIRMTGLMLLFHIAVFVMMIISVMREGVAWRRVMGTVAISGALVALPMYFSIFGESLEVVKSTFGNDSYTAAYLTFSFFFSLILFFQVKTQRARLFFAACAFLIIFSPLFLSPLGFLEIFTSPAEILGTARAATTSVFIGLVLSALAYAASSSRKLIARIGGVAFVILFTVLLVLSLMVYVPGSPVQQKFGEAGIGSRLVFWESAIEGIKERPLLGYGPENYFLPFYQNFNPALLTAEYGYEVYSSKPHSAYLEVLVSGGVLSFIPYLAIWILGFFLLWRIWKEHRLPVTETALLVGLLVSYLIQNLVLFDTLSSYMGIGVVIAYLVHVSSANNDVHIYPAISRRISWSKTFACAAVVVVIGYCFVLMPVVQQTKLIHALEEVTVKERAEMYTDLFALSTGLRTSMAEYLMGKTLGAVPSILGEVTSKQKSLLLNDVSSLRKTIQSYVDTDNLVHYRHTLYLARLYLLEFVLEGDLDKRKELLDGVRGLENSLERLSPNNPQNSWVKAQRELFEENDEAALATLKKANESAPDIPATEEKIIQVEEYIAGEGNTPFFTD